MFQIPLFDLNFGKEEEKAVIDVLQSKWISIGPKCEEFENTFAQMLGSKYALAVSNCTDALHLACYALGITDGDEVIVPSLTFAATVNCVTYVGGTPVFCDIKSTSDFSIDDNLIENLITSRTKAIIPMHFAGYACDMQKIMDIAERYGLYVIEDACHGPLSEYHGKKLGTMGNVGCFSFFSNKNISTGEGGMIVTEDEELYKRLKLLRSHGMTTMSYQRASGHATSYDIAEIGFNFRMDDIRAAIGIAQLNKLRSDLELRKEVRKIYEKQLREIKQIVIPYYGYAEFTTNYIMPVVLKDSDRNRRDSVRQKLHEMGIQTSVHYPAIHCFSAYQNQNIQLPVTEYVTNNEITLPMYGKLAEEQIKYICDMLALALEEIV